MPKSISENEIKKVFDAYYFGLIEFSWRIVRCEETGRDIVQDVFVKLLESNYHLPAEEHRVKSYLYTMVKNSSLNYLRREEVAERYQERTVAEEVQWEENILDALIYGESIRELHAAIETLPAACQQICKLTFLEEKSNQEAAELTFNTG